MDKIPEDFRKRTIEDLRRNRAIVPEPTDAERITQLTAERDELARLLNLNESGISAVMAAIEGKRKAEAQVERLQYALKLSETQHRQALEQKDALQQQIAEIGKPVTDEEWNSIWHSTARDFANKLLAARLKS